MAKIGREKFEEVKEMCGFCKSTEFIAKKCGVSKATVNRIRNAETYEAFTQWSQKSIENRMKKKAEKEAVTEAPATVEAVAVSDVAEIKDIMKKTLSVLEEMLSVWKEG